MRRDLCRYVIRRGGTSPAFSHALAESTPGESEPSVTAKPSTEPTSAPVDEPSAEPTAAPASDSSSTSGSTSSSSSSAAATAAPTATPAPVLNQAEVEVVGAEEIFSAEEYAEVTKLPLQEQILVTLSSVGCDQIAQSIIRSMNLTLSAKANELSVQLGGSENLMAQECERKLAETFPAYQATVNGVTYRFYVMTAQVKVNGVIQNVHFGFRLDENGEWVLVHLDEADMVPLA